MAKNPGKMTRREKIALASLKDLPMKAKELRQDEGDLQRLVQRGVAGSVDVEGVTMFYREETDAPDACE